MQSLSPQLVNTMKETMREAVGSLWQTPGFSEEKITQVFTDSVLKSPFQESLLLQLNLGNILTGKQILFLHRLYNDPDHIRTSSINSDKVLLEKFQSIMLESFEVTLIATEPLPTAPNPQSQAAGHAIEEIAAAMNNVELAPESRSDRLRKMNVEETIAWLKKRNEFATVGDLTETERKLRDNNITGTLLLEKHGRSTLEKFLAKECKIPAGIACMTHIAVINFLRGK